MKDKHKESKVEEDKSGDLRNEPKKKFEFIPKKESEKTIYGDPQYVQFL